MTIIVRADASATAGTGHVMRCLALADAARAAGHRVVLASVGLPGPLVGLARSRGVEVRPLAPDHHPADVRSLADAEDAAWVVVDGYGFGPRDLAAMRGRHRVLVVDDHAALETYPADIVVNANAYATRGAYAGRAGHARLLVGPRYALLRSEFARYVDWRREVRGSARRIIVTMGGADPAGATELVVEALADERGDAHMTVVIGAGNRRATELADRLAAHRSLDVRQAVDDMPSLMADADVAVASAGSTAWELAFMQLPALAVVIADNQVAVAQSLERHGIAESLGRLERLEPERIRERVRALLLDPERRAAMATAGRALVDGRGAARVVRAMAAAGVSLRPATVDDAALLFEWANDPVTRAASFHSEPIAWSDHLPWLERRLRDRDSLVMVAHDGAPVGQVRFERVSELAVISVGLAPDARGRGLAAAVIDAGAREAFNRWPIGRIRADIRSDNLASLAAFVDAGFGAREPHADRPDAISLWLERADAAEQGRQR